MPERFVFIRLLEAYRKLATGDYGVAPTIVALEKEIGCRSASPASYIEDLHRRIAALERENTLLSFIGGSVQYANDRR